MSENTNNRHTMFNQQKDTGSSDSYTDEEEQKLKSELRELEDEVLHYSTNITSAETIDTIEILRIYDSISDLVTIINDIFFTHPNITKLINNLYKKNKSTSNQMMFHIKEMSEDASINNIYIFKDNIFKCIIKDEHCPARCFIIDIIFSNFEEKTIEILKINEIVVYTTLHDIIYKWVLKVMRDNYIQYLMEQRQVQVHLPYDWKFNINNLNILKNIVDIPDNVKICEQCRYYNVDIKLLCPIQQIRCCNYKYCSTLIERKNMEHHLIECNKTKYGCNNEGCEEQLYPDEMREHIYKCIYREVRCFECPWRGYFKDKKNHERIKLDGSNWMPWETESEKICKGGK